MISLQSFSKSCLNIRVCKEEIKGQVQMFWWGDGFPSPWESFSYLITHIANFYLKNYLHFKKSAICRQGLNQPEHSLQKSKIICFQVQGNVRTRLLLPESLENLIFKKVQDTQQLHYGYVFSCPCYYFGNPDIETVSPRPELDFVFLMTTARN